MTAETRDTPPTHAGAPPDNRPVGWRAWATLAVLTGAMVFSLLDRFAISLLIEPIKADLGLSDVDIGLLSGVAFGVFYAVMAVPMGVLADRWSRRGVIVGGVAVWSASTAACAAASTMPQLLAARIGVGAGEAGLAPASYSIIAQLFPRRTLARALSTFQMGAIVGSGITFWLVGLIIEYFSDGAGRELAQRFAMAPWQATFVAVALPGVAFIVLLALIRLPPQPPTASDRAELLRHLAANGAFYTSLMLGMSGILIVNYALLSWAPAILQREFGLAPGEVGASYGAVVLSVSPLAVLTGGWITDSLLRRRRPGATTVVPIGAAVLCGLGATALGLATTQHQVYAAFALLHFGAVLPVGVAPAIIQMHAPATIRSGVSALYVMVVNVAGLGFGPVLVGALSDHLPPTPGALRTSVLLLCAVASVVALAAFVRLRRHYRRAAA